MWVLREHDLDLFFLKQKQSPIETSLLPYIDILITVLYVMRSLNPPHTQTHTPILWEMPFRVNHLKNNEKLHDA